MRVAVEILVLRFEVTQAAVSMAKMSPVLVVVGKISLQELLCVRRT